MTLQYYHFSIDDVFNCLLDVSHAPELLFQHHFFQFLEQLHEDYQATVDLYAFFAGADHYHGKNLSHVSSRLQESLSRAPWLFFGPHALDRAHTPHCQSLEQQFEFCQTTYRQLERIAGSDAGSAWVRFHYFSECFELAELLKQHRVTALLTTDKPVACYRLPPLQREQLQSRGTTHYNAIEFVSSHIRVEDIVAADGSMDTLDEELMRRVGNAECAVVFTHEYELNRPEVRDMTRRIFDWIERRSLQPVQSRTASPTTGFLIKAGDDDSN